MRIIYLSQTDIFFCYVSAWIERMLKTWKLITVESLFKRSSQVQRLPSKHRLVVDYLKRTYKRWTYPTTSYFIPKCSQISFTKDNFSKKKRQRNLTKKVNRFERSCRGKKVISNGKIIIFLLSFTFFVN